MARTARRRPGRRHARRARRGAARGQAPRRSRTTSWRPQARSSPSRHRTGHRLRSDMPQINWQRSLATAHRLATQTEPPQVSGSLGVQTGRTGRIDDSSRSAIDQNRVGRATGVAHGTLPEGSGRQSSSDDERDTTERGVADGLTKPAVQQCATGFRPQESSLPMAQFRWQQDNRSSSASALATVATGRHGRWVVLTRRTHGCARDSRCMHRALDPRLPAAAAFDLAAAWRRQNARKRAAGGSESARSTRKVAAEAVLDSPGAPRTAVLARVDALAENPRSSSAAKMEAPRSSESQLHRITTAPLRSVAARRSGGMIHEHR